jgi:hypothetical protein
MVKMVLSFVLQSQQNNTLSLAARLALLYQSRSTLILSFALFLGFFQEPLC